MKRFTTLLLCLVFALTFLAACATDAPTPAHAPAPAPAPSPAPPPPPASPAPAPAVPAESPPAAPAATPPPAAAPAFPGDAASGNYITLPTLTPFARGRALVYTVNMTLQTLDFMPQMRYIFNTVGNLGGYTMRAEIFGHDLRSPYTERHGRFTFRVPTYNLDDLIISMENSFNVYYYLQLTDDQTVTYRATVSELERLQELELYLQEELDRTRNNDIARDLRVQLANIRSAIRQFEQQQADITYTVVYSTVNIALFEVIFPEIDDTPEPEPPEPPTFGERLNDAVARSVEGFTAFAQNLLLFLVAIAPVLIIIALAGALALVVVVIIKGAKRRRVPKIISSEIEPSGNDDSGV